MTARHSMTEPAATAAIDSGCRMLRLPTIRERFAEIAATAEREHHTYLGFLAELVIAECDERDHRRAERRIRDAGFPRPKRLEDFSFEANLLPVIERDDVAVISGDHDGSMRTAPLGVLSGAVLLSVTGSSPR